jgi:two-component system, cell cycle sensor histidine kinase and response regulator CckA
VITELELDSETASRPAPECLLCLSEPLRGTSWALRDELLIGRSSRCDIVLHVDPVSRRHARVTREAGGYLIEDLNSRNGTFVNGQRIERRRLVVGDRITVGGEVTLLFTVHDRLHERLAAAQKMEALGRLLGGVVHDFKNLLACVVSNAQVLAENLDDRELAAECIADTLLAAERGAEMAQQLLAYARRSGGLAPIDLAAVVDEISRLVGRGLPPGVELVAEPKAAVVLGDRAQLCQLLLNLCVNARDAVGDRGRIEIVVSPDPATGRVVVQVSDNGRGMSAEVRERLFEPFFTTKGAGEGSGLGMAVVAGVVASHGGEIEVDSRPGGGTTVRVALALLDGASLPAAGSDDSASPTPSAPGAVVLLVDDDELVLRGTRRVIERMGCPVVCAAGGEAALRMVHAMHGQIAIAVVDYVMPGMAGDELVGELRRRCPGIKLIMMTGTVDRAAIARLEPMVDRLLAKPCDPAKLRAAIAAHLS